MSQECSLAVVTTNNQHLENNNTRIPEVTENGANNKKSNETSFLKKIQQKLLNQKQPIKFWSLVLLNILVITYFILATVRFDPNRKCDKVGNRVCELGWQRAYYSILVIFVLLYTFIFYYKVFKPFAVPKIKQLLEKASKKQGKWVKIILLGVFITTKIILLLYILIVEVSQDYKRLQSLLGIVFVLAFGYCISNDRSQINWRAVLRACFVQIIFAFGILKQEMIREVLNAIADHVLYCRMLSVKGAQFVFGDFLPNEQAFAFFALPVIFLLGFITATMQYLGWIQVIIVKVGSILGLLAITTCVESVFAGARLFFGVSEALLIIAPFIKFLTDSELHAVLTAAFSSSAGFTISMITALGGNSIHVVTANTMTIPATLAISKLIYPETSETKLSEIEIRQHTLPAESLFEAGIKGVLKSIKIYINTIAIVVVLIAIVAFFDIMLEGMFTLIHYEDVTLEWTLGWIFTPICYLTGIPWSDANHAGNIIGTKIVNNELVGYEKLMTLLRDGVVSPRTAAITTFVLCSFTNPTAIAVVISNFFAIAPESTQKMFKLINSAFIAGLGTSLMTASVAGFLMNSDMYSFNVTAQTMNISKLNLHYL